MRWIILFFANTSILAGWLFLILPAKRQLPMTSERLLAAGLMATTQVIATSLVLGVAFNLLARGPLLIVNLLIAGGLLAQAALRGQIAPCLRELAAGAKDGFRLVKNSNTLIALVGLSTLIFLWTLFLVWVFPAVEWDSLTYHLPDIAFFNQYHAIRDVAGPTDPIMWINGYPKNIELLFHWMFAIPDTDRLIDSVQLGFAVMAVLAIYVAGRKMSLSPANSLMAGLFYFLTPVVIMQGRTNYIDLAASALIWVTIAFLYNNGARHYPWRFVMGGAAMGIFAGAKFSGVLFAAIVLASLVIIGAVRTSPRWSTGAQMRALTLVLIPCLLLSGYWYGKNAYVHQNPFWPFKIEVAGAAIFGNGLFTEADVNGPVLPDQLAELNVAQRSLFVWREQTDGLRYDSFFAGFGPFWFALGLSAVPFFAFDVIRRRKKTMLWPLGVILAAYLVHPLNWWPRYTQFLVPGGALAFAYLLEFVVRRSLLRIFSLAAILLISYGVLLSSTQTFFTPSLIKRWLISSEQDRFVSNMYTSANKPIHASSPRGVLGNGPLGEAYQYIYQHEPTGVNVSASENITSLYPIWGRDLKNRFYFFWPEEYDTWLASLKDKRIRYILVRANSRTYDFTSGHPGDFELVFADRKHIFFVYELRGIRK